MTVLTQESLEFAKEHISRFYDTDFYPKPFEFEAIWYNWGEVVKELTSRNIHKMAFNSPRSLPWKKPKGGYRVVHQLEPLDSLVYVALVYQVANDIELARIPQEESVACAYRINISEGSLFAAGSGYERFREASKSLASNYSHVLLTDITDFYNQLYLHRLNNAIEHSNPKQKNLADDIEYFLTALNDKASQGVPVGPASSIVLAEAVLIDVDQFLIDLGVEHTRYVDDFRIFSSDIRELDKVLQHLTHYLYANHRLTLSSEKTFVLSAHEFIGQLENPYEIEKIRVIEEIEVLHPYTQETLDVEYVEDDEKSDENVAQKIYEALEGVVKKNPIDLGFGRALLRQARGLKTKEIVPLVTKYFDLLAPMSNNVIIYLNEVADDQLVEELRPFFSSIADANYVQSELIRMWIEWFLTNHVGFIKDAKIRAFLYKSPSLITQARAAVLEKNISWVRNKKSSYLNSGLWERRAILFASQILPTDEKEAWLKQASLASPYILDQWVSKWVLRKDDELSF